jgi:hypothetical protein
VTVLPSERVHHAKIGLCLSLLMCTACAGTGAEMGALRVWKNELPACAPIVSEWVHAAPGQYINDRVRARADELHATDVKLGEPTSDHGGEGGGGAIAPRSSAGVMASTGHSESWDVHAVFFRCDPPDPRRPQ